MIPLVFALAAILVITAVTLFVADRRHRNTNETAVALPSSPSLYGEPSDSTGRITSVAAKGVVSEQPDSLGRDNSETASVVRPNIAADADSEVVVKAGLATDIDSGTGVSTAELGTLVVEKVPAEPEFVLEIELGGPVEISETAEDTGASETSEATADLNVGADMTLQSGAAPDAEPGVELGKGPGAEPAESVTAEDTNTTDEFKIDLVGDTVATEAGSSNAVDARAGTVTGTEFQVAPGSNAEAGGVPQPFDFTAHTQTTQETSIAQPIEPTQPVQP